jgi:cytochrome c oxidase subunit II
MVTALAIYGWIVLDDLEAKQPNTLIVNVTGQQFTWSFDYPSEKVESHELVLPKDRPVEFRIHTKDVLHSFWVPEFRLKSDAVPGLTTKIRLTPDRIGRYQVVCAELCGIGHSTMRQNVRVVAATAFDSWLDDQKQEAAGGGGGGETGGGETGGGGGDGAAVFAANGCASCHTLKPANATGTVGPDLDEIKTPTAAFIRQSIVDPNKEVEEGFSPGIMPQDFGDKLSPDELDALVEYLLKAQK